MPDWLSIHEPVLVNTIGHAAGAVIFGMLLYFFLVNLRRGGRERGSLPVVAAALAMIWNLGSLIALATGPAGGRMADIIVAVSFSVLSLLPAVLLNISLGSHHRWVWVSGYVLSVLAVALHAADLVTGAARLHFAALLLVTIGFTGLTIISVYLELRQENRAAGSRLAAAMGLFLFAISFLHFGAGHSSQAWSKEVALHHAGLPLAVFVLLQDYRFILLDAFLRFIVNGTLAAGAILITIRVIQTSEFDAYLRNPFQAGLLFVAASLVLTLFVYIRNRIQRFLTRVIFLRSNVDEALKELLEVERASGSEREYLSAAAEIIARFMRTSQFEYQTENAELRDLTAPAAIIDSNHSMVPPWVQAILPIRFSSGDATYLLLGARDGGRRYLSEDFGVLARLTAAVVEHVEQLRNQKMQTLVSQAELKALQAQINPHFLFNSLNTLYGTIDRNNAGARRLVLNLSDVFRYLLRSERTLVDVEEELRIVRAYLEIETLRLGPKLRTELEVEEEAMHVSIPLLSIQPLVENAVKHGVASRSGPGFVRLAIKLVSGGLAVEISNSGAWGTRESSTYPGIGMNNVKRRLELCYGPEARFDVSTNGGITSVGFVLPAKPLREISAVV